MEIDSRMVTRSRALPKETQFEGNTIGPQDIGRDERIEYICPQCHTNSIVTITNKTNSELFCKRCSSVYSPEDETVRHRHKLEVPENTEPAISIVNIDLTKDVEIRHTPPIRGGLAELQKRGLKITNYRTTEKE